MKKAVSLFLALCLILSLSAFSCNIVSAAGSRGLVFVATNGRDDAEGTIDAPLATLQAAQQKVRDMKASGAYPHGITVFVRGGVYNISKPLILTEEDSGTANAPIVWRQYENETVTFTGGITVAGSKFQKVTDKAILERVVDKSAHDSLYSLNLKQYGIDDPGEPYLFGSYGYNSSVTSLGLATKPEAPAMEVMFNSKPMTPARYPNDGYMTVERVVEPGWDYDKPDAYPKGTPFKIQVSDDRLKYWTKAPEDSIMMFGFWKWEWADQTIPLHKIDAANKQITSKWHSVFSVAPEKPFYVTNLIEELDKPGEYYIDNVNSILYINPPSDLKSAEITMSVLEEVLFQIDGADYVTFKGLDVKGARNSAYVIHKGNYNKIVDCEISYTAMYAVIMYGSHNGIVDSYIHDVDGGVRLFGGDIATLTKAENYCVNNHFENFARLTKAYKPAVSIDGIGNLAAHNEMHGSTHQAVAFGGQLNKIMYNNIYDVMSETDDAGAIYGGLAWHTRGHDIKYNYIHDIKNAGSGGVGLYAIYGDGGQCELYICGNVIENIAGGAVLVNGGWDNIVLNNYMIDCETGIDVSAIMSGVDIAGFYKHHYPRLQEVEKYIMDSPQWKEIFPTFFRMMAVSDVEKSIPTYNVLANNIAVGGSVCTARSYQNATVEQNIAVTGDPGFKDKKNRDYNIKEDSQLFNQMPGFKAVPFTRMGRLDELAYGRVKDAVVMSVGSPRGMVGSELVAIDADSKAVAPFIDGDRTYVPLRFLSESLGAGVNFADGVITISDANVNLEMALNSTEAKKNGEAIMLDKPPVVIDGRTMVPLRQVSELLDRQVYWHSSGLIAISDDATLFDAEEGTDDDIINFLREKINYYN